MANANNNEVIERMVIKRLNAMGLEPIVFTSVEYSNNLHHNGITIQIFNIWTGENEPVYMPIETYRGAGQICQLVIEFKKRKKLNPGLTFYLRQLYYDYDIQECERTLTIQGGINE
jgi:hypothetical protein